MRSVMGEEEAFLSSALLRWACAVLVTFPSTSIKVPQPKERAGTTHN